MKWQWWVIGVVVACMSLPVAWIFLRDETSWFERLSLWRRIAVFIVMGPLVLAGFAIVLLVIEVVGSLLVRPSISRAERTRHSRFVAYALRPAREGRMKKQAQDRGRRSDRGDHRIRLRCSDYAGGHRREQLYAGISTVHSRPALRRGLLRRRRERPPLHSPRCCLPG